MARLGKKNLPEKTKNKIPREREENRKTKPPVVSPASDERLFYSFFHDIAHQKKEDKNLARRMPTKGVSCRQGVPDHPVEYFCLGRMCSPRAAVCLLFDVEKLFTEKISSLWKRFTRWWAYIRVLFTPYLWYSEYYAFYHPKHKKRLIQESLKNRKSLKNHEKKRLIEKNKHKKLTGRMLADHQAVTKSSTAATEPLITHWRMHGRDSIFFTHLAVAG